MVVSLLLLFVSLICIGLYFYTRIARLSFRLSDDQDYDIFFGAFEGGSYYQKKSITKAVSLEDYSIFFITLLENASKNILIKNPFVKDQVPFYRLYESYYNQKLYYNKLN